jgi:hypothetical protein
MFKHYQTTLVYPYSSRTFHQYQGVFWFGRFQCHTKHTKQTNYLPSYIDYFVINYRENNKDSQWVIFHPIPISSDVNHQHWRVEQWYIH